MEVDPNVPYFVMIVGYAADCLKLLGLDGCAAEIVEVKKYRLCTAFPLGAHIPGRSWEVTVETRTNKTTGKFDYYMSKGWKEIAYTVCLTVGDFMLFKVVADDTLIIELYDGKRLNKKGHLEIEDSCGGWSEFLRASAIRDGDLMRFYFAREGVMLVRVLRQ